MTLFGYGKTTGAIAQKFGNCNIYDDKFNEVQEFGTNKLIPMNQFNPDNSICEIPSPGIPPYHESLKKAKNLISEYDLFAKDAPFSIWISGTNGKTTTTQMLDLILKKRGSISGGNIGTPLAQMNRDANIWILETSSFTLHYTKIAKPNIYALLPITQDHIEWHGNFENYENAKLKPLLSMQEGELAIIPSKYKDIKTDAFVVDYDSTQDLAKKFDIDISQINFKEPFLQDAVIALCITKSLYNECEYSLINSFVLDPHKMELFLDHQKRIWIDDSKATNFDATLKALSSFTNNEKLLIILGGDDKGADLKELFIKMSSLNIEIFAIGSNANKLINLSEKYKIKANLCGFLEIAVSKINAIHTQNSIAILSPAAASLDQFTSYKERGLKFKEYILNLS